MASIPHGMSRYDKLLRECLNHRALNDAHVLPQVFGYLLDENPITGNLSRQTIVDGFDAMVESMRTSTVADGPAEAGMTFFGQFIDHDITLDATSAIGTKIDPRSIRNVRTPNLDLDCVYGDGPEASPHLYSNRHEGFMLFGREDSHNDLQRNRDGRAIIGDPRNDENIIVSQVQGAFICLHNILMTHAEAGASSHADVKACAEMGVRRDVWCEIVPPKLHDFESVRRFIRLHYQWLILNEFLPAFVDEKSIHAALHHDPFHDRGPIMPAEFSVAAYRFGHATVQPSYVLRHGEDPVDLFQMLGFSHRGPESDLHMAQVFGSNAQRALPVGLKMADTLFSLPDNVVRGPLMWGDLAIPEERAKKLGLRNILRDRTALHLPSGQQVARTLGIPELAAPKPLRDHHIDKTPLWVYCLQEAEEQGGGKLTGVGGAIVASVFVRLLKLDPESVLNTPGFAPWSGFGPTCSMASVMGYVEAHRNEIAHRADLRNG
jgi:hypothetical protein